MSTSPRVHAHFVLGEATGRDTATGLDLYADGALVLDDVEREVQGDDAVGSEAMTWSAPLRSYGPTFTRDNRYPLRWTDSPDHRIDSLIVDLAAFAAFAAFDPRRHRPRPATTRALPHPTARRRRAVELRPEARCRRRDRPVEHGTRGRSPFLRSGMIDG